MLGKDSDSAGFALFLGVFKCDKTVVYDGFKNIAALSFRFEKRGETIFSVNGESLVDAVSHQAENAVGGRSGRSSFGDHVSWMRVKNLLSGGIAVKLSSLIVADDVFRLFGIAAINGFCGEASHCESAKQSQSNRFFYFFSPMCVFV